MTEPIEIVLAKPRGFCAGVDRAIAIVERALEVHGAPIYVRHEIVHNKFVVEDLRRKGAVFVEELSEVPAGGTVIFSAHGVSQAVRREAAGRGLQVFDATCPLVTKVHVEVARMREHGREVVMIGHQGHPEAEGTMGQSRDGMYLVESEADVAKLAVKDPAKPRLRHADDAVDGRRAPASWPRCARASRRSLGPKKDDICYATQNRQDAVKFMAPRCDVVIVVGSTNSSNSNRLREVAENLGRRAYLVDRAEEIRAEWIAGARTIGVTAGASAPEVLVQDVIASLQRLGAARVRELEGITESVTFPLPRSIARSGTPQA